jgi:hypothetical protein
LEQFSFYLSGASDTEKAMVEKQLSVMATFLDAKWNLIKSSDASEVDLELVLSTNSESVSSRLRIELIEDREFVDPDFVFEKPIRALNLVYMLNESRLRLGVLNKQQRLSVSQEMDHSHDATTAPKIAVNAVHWQSAAKWLAEISALECVYQCNDVYLVSSPSKKLFKTNALSKDQLIQVLSETSLDAWNKSDALSILNSSLDVSTSSLIWSVALKEAEYAKEHWLDKNALYRLKRWPQLGVWPSTAEMFKLSSLYGRKSASINTGVMVSGAVDSEVALFLHACDSVGLGVEISDQEVDSVKNPPIDASLAVLQAFKSKLGI